MAQASDIRAGGAYYQLSVEDNLQPQLEKAKSKAKSIGDSISTLTTGKASKITLPQLDKAASPDVKGANKYTGTLENVLNAQRQLDAQTKGTTGFINTLSSGFKTAISGVQAFASALTKVGGSLSLISGAASAPLLALFKGGVNRGTELANLSRQLGVPIEVLNKMQYAAERAGVSLDEVMQDRFGRYSDLIANAPSINPQDALAAAEAQKSLSDATRAFQDALLPLVQTITPFVKQLAAWSKENAHLIAPLVPLVGGLVALGVAATVSGFAISGLITVGSALIVVIKGIGAALLFLVTNPVGLAILGVGALTYAFFTATDSGKKLAGIVRGDLVNAFNTAKTSWTALSNFLRKGDLEGALEVTTTSIELLWAGLTLRLTRGWNEFKKHTVDTFHQITFGLGPILQSLWNDIKSGWNSLVGFVSGVVDKIVSVWERIKEPVLRLVKFLSPALAVIFAPFIASAYLIQEIWENLDTNISINLNNLAKFLHTTFVQITGDIENLFKSALDVILQNILKVVKSLNALDTTGRLGLPAVITQIEKFQEVTSKKRDVKTEVSEIKRAHKAIEDKLRAEEEEAKINREDSRAADEKKGKDEVEKLEKKLQGLSEKAAIPRAPGIQDKLTQLRPELLGQISVKGGFSSAALGQQFNVSDQVLRQTELLKALLEESQNTPKKIAVELAPLVGSPRSR